MKTIQLRHFVNNCAMDTIDDRMEFRKHFILLMLTMFLSPTVQHVISSWHIDTILDVSDPVLYFQKLKHAVLEQCQEPELWLSAWIAMELSAMASTIQLEDYVDTSGNDVGVVEELASKVMMNLGPEREGSHRTKTPLGSTKGSDKRGGVSNGSVCTDAPSFSCIRRR